MNLIEIFLGLFLQNSVIQAFAKTFEKWKNVSVIDSEDKWHFHAGRILRISDKAWNKIFTNKVNSNYKKSLKEEILEQIKREKHSNLAKKYEKSHYTYMPIWSIVLFLDFGILMLIIKSFNTICFNYVIEHFQEKSYVKYKMNRGEFNSIFYLLKDIRNKVCHSDVLYNYDNESNQVISINAFLRRNNLTVENINRFRFFDLVRLISIISKGFDDSLQSLVSFKNNVKNAMLCFTSKSIFNAILEFMHFSTFNFIYKIN
ncbi:Abi family protein [Metamycoplasma salivarium]|uniref:Abi family protein n=1 Tax=Metamycoplasma salivarium TaxID=2124 RepID=UPI000462EFF2|nr:Abi family protein [Metamycoplasma salivarium]